MKKSEMVRTDLKTILNYFKADFAYTADGVKLEALEYENFNAATVGFKLLISQGLLFILDSAKNKLINAFI